MKITRKETRRETNRWGKGRTDEKETKQKREWNHEYRERGRDPLW